MKKAFIFGGATVGSYIGWYLGSLVDDFYFPLGLSMILGIAGVVLAWKLLQRF